jgi:hypothetical protein
MNQARVTVSLTLAAATLMLSIACTPRTYSPSQNEEIYGTWTNPNYAQQKLVMSADGTWKSFSYPNDTAPYSSGTFKLVKKWKDGDGNTWYNEDFRLLKGGVYTFNGQQLDKIDKSGKVLEAIFVEVGQFDPKNYPKELDPKSESYGVFNRSE